jgi:hypothetical protein
MSDKTRGHRGAWRTGRLAAVAAIAALTTACDVVHVHFGGSPASAPTSTKTVTYQADLAYAHCMQAHGLPKFPDPPPTKGLIVVESPNASADSAVGRANAACEHLLS